jgi:putative SOS response-associated peptidase YedK
MIDTVVEGNSKRELVPMRWGIIPGWWSKSFKEMKMATFNARAESIAIKPMFRDSFRSRRCLIPASGYYEWHDTPEGKQPYYFTRRDGQVMTIAGIQDGWLDKATGEMTRSCGMVITEPNAFVAEVHDRMPVILEPDQFEAWTSGDVATAAAMMKPAGEDVLDKRAVSRRVNSCRTSEEDATLIEGIGVDAVNDFPNAGRQTRLF